MSSPIRSPPLLFRILTVILPAFATLLFITTLYLFHLHHAHNHPEDDASDLQHAYGINNGAPNSPGGSALRHKMDLAQFLLEKHDKEKKEKGILEAQAQGVWRGDNEEHFIQPVEEINVSDGKEESSFGNQNNAMAGAGDAGDDDGNKEAKGAESGVEMHKAAEKNEKLKNAIIPKDDTNYSPSSLSWKQLQETILKNNLLPPPIPLTRTARGFSGLPSSSQTPALDGALRGTIHCPDTDPRIQDVMSSMLAFWNDPRGARDTVAGYTNYKPSQIDSNYNETHPHPFLPPPLPPFSPGAPRSSNIRRRYLTFEPDTGGWNNLRISLENIIVFAAVTGRTLVLPPEQVIYLLEARRGDRRGRQYTDFFNLTENADLLRRLPIISSKEFLEIEGHKNGVIPIDYNSTFTKHLWDISENCEQRRKSDVYCEDLYDHYHKYGQLANISAEWPTENCFIFDESVFTHGDEYIPKLSPEVQKRIMDFCGTRIPIYYSQSMHEAPVWHFETMDFKYRLLIHYYALIFFTDPQIGNYYRRFVRDFLRYHDTVFCAAGRVVLALQYEGYLRSIADSTISTKNYLSKTLDSELVGGFSSLHIRRGDLQFKEVKFDSATWYENTRECWGPNEVLYIATDERDQTFFDDFRKMHSGKLRFLDEYKDLVELDKIDPTLYGMIDTVIAARGRNFAGTWFSTFSGYIVRLRGYYGLSKFSSYYSYLPRKYWMQSWTNIGTGSMYAREYPTAWTSIDGDVFVDSDREGERDPEAWKAVIESSIQLQSGHIINSAVNTPIVDTPALKGAKRGHITCDKNVDSLVYWNDPAGSRDYTFTSQFRDRHPDAKTKYIAFQLDHGGFNNIRMSFEILLVLAKALDRTLVLPPDQPMYLLRNDASKKGRGLDDFFNMQGESFNLRVDILTFEEFLRLEGVPGGQFPVPVEEMDGLLGVAKGCHEGSGSIPGFAAPCRKMHDYLVQHAVTPNITSNHQCLVFDEGMYYNGVPEDDESASKFCNSGNRRKVYVTKEFNNPSLLYIQAGTKETRMLAHFYGYILFTDVSIGNFFKRYIRDLVHYRDEIFCAAGKIIAALEDAAVKHGFSEIDNNGIGGYSALHVRRGDFQYKKMKLSADELYNNTRSIWQTKILYIATDEKNKTFFEPFRRAGHIVMFLSDFHELIGKENMDPNHMGMIETVVAARGRDFAGTYFSTFSGYINRLRGYYGISMKRSWYTSLDRKFMMQEWDNVNMDTYAKEWPDAWVGINADVAPSRDIF